MKRPVASSAHPDPVAAIAAAVEALASDQLIVFPTETVYGLGASARSKAGIDRLAAATAASRAGRPSGPISWHAPSREAATRAIQPAHPVHIRLIRRLLPGPVTIVVERSPEEMRDFHTLTGLLPGTADDGRDACIRVPDHAIARELLEAAARGGIPVIAESIAAGGFGNGTQITPALREAMTRGEIGGILDDGPTRLGKPSTRLRLRRDGGFDILRVGAVEERSIRKHLERNILFVCSGNTCRSPMAATIARSLIPPPDSGLVMRVRSAGAFAAEGEPITSESIAALKSLGIDTRDARGHKSHELTRQMIVEADVIYAMTAAHAKAIRSIDPTAADKIQTLDPSGQDIPDPIGGSQAVYTRTAEKLRELIKQRLAELGP